MTKKYGSLTSDQFARLFQSELERLMRKVQILKQVQQGSAGVRRIKVKGAAAHHVKKGTDHYRYIVERRKP